MPSIQNTKLNFRAMMTFWDQQCENELSERHPPHVFIKNRMLKGLTPSPMKVVFMFCGVSHDAEEYIYALFFK